MAYKVGMVSLGCPKNQVDAEIMLHILRQAGYEICSDEMQADAIIVNTCGFIEDAKRESIEQILELSALKEKGRLKAVIVTGCLAERYRDQVQMEMPEVDAVVGIGSNEDIANIVKNTLLGYKSQVFTDKYNLPLKGGRILTTPRYTAYLKIAEGCDNHCTYCAIPMIRGRFRSRSIGSVVEEAAELLKDGVKELVLVAQDTTRYGEDLYGSVQLASLLKKLALLPGAKWIRILYTYPERIDDRLLSVMREHKNILPYLDIPIQHCDGEVLKRMNRTGNRRTLEKLIEKIREQLPDVTIRTTLIAGFPGETEQQFSELCEFVKSVQFDRLGCFSYSPEEGTAAALFIEQLEEQEKIRRQELILQEQMTISERLGRKKIGKKFEILVEGYDKDIKCYYGRSYADAPEIDGKVFFYADRELDPGEFVQVLINDVVEYDLLGELVK